MLDSEKKTERIKITECMAVSKRGDPKCELHIGDIKLRQVWKFNYLGTIVINDRVT